MNRKTLKPVPDRIRLSMAACDYVRVCPIYHGKCSFWRLARSRRPIRRGVPRPEHYLRFQNILALTLGNIPSGIQIFQKPYRARDAPPFFSFCAVRYRFVSKEILFQCPSCCQFPNYYTAVTFCSTLRNVNGILLI